MDEARSNLESVFQWAKENKDDVIIEKSGKPEGVLVPYDEYTEIVRLRKQELKRNAWAARSSIRLIIFSKSCARHITHFHVISPIDHSTCQETPLQCPFASSLLTMPGLP